MNYWIGGFHCLKNRFVYFALFPETPMRRNCGKGNHYFPNNI